MGRYITPLPESFLPFPNGNFGTGYCSEITTSRQITIPSNIYLVRMRVTGGGGVGGSTIGSGRAASGGTTSFGTYLSATGGQGGMAAINNNRQSAYTLGGVGGYGVGGDVRATGGDGGSSSPINEVYIQGDPNNLLHIMCATGGGGAAGTVLGDGADGAVGYATNASGSSSVARAGIGGTVAGIKTSGTNAPRFTGEEPFILTGTTSLFNGFDTIDVSSGDTIQIAYNVITASGTGRKTRMRGDGACGAAFIYNNATNFSALTANFGGGGGGVLSVSTDGTTSHATALGGGGGGGGFAMGVFYVVPGTTIYVTCGANGGFAVIEY